MADSVSIKINGLDEVKNLLSNLAPKSAQNILRNTVYDIAAEVRDEAKDRVPVDSGNLRSAIKAERRRGTRGSIEASVNVTSGEAAKRDGWYWRFVEFGTRLKGARPFLLPASESVAARLDDLLSQLFVARYDREMARLAKKKARG